MLSVLEIIFLSIAYCSSIEIHGNRKLEESTIRSLFQRSIGDYEAFDVSSLQEVNKNMESFRTRNTRSASPTELQVSAFGEDYRMEVSKPEPVLHPKARIVMSDGSGEREWTGTVPDCFLAGHLTSHDGTVSLSDCDGLEGRLSTKAGDFHIKELPKVHNKRFNFTDDETALVIAKATPYGTPDIEDGVHLPELTDHMSKTNAHQRRQRSTHSKNVVVEMAVYADSKYIERVLPKDVGKRIELIISKYNGAQMEWSRSNELGYNVKIQIKHIGFMEKNPSFYNMSSILGESLSTFCAGMKDNPNAHYDLIFLHTGMNTDVKGRAYQSSACNPSYRCAVESSTYALEYKATAHEMGHSLGMFHDYQQGCTGSDVGLMGGYGAGWSSCSIRDFDLFLQSSNGQCLFQENVTIPDSDGYSAGPLAPYLIGQRYSLDEVCENMHGPNFHFRTFPYLGNCEQYSCVNFNQGYLFGQMFTHYSDIPGSYCGAGKICFNRRCATFAEARQTPGVVRPGGWGPWTTWYPCSRTCGTGITYRRRFCNNPSPLNHPDCAMDDGYEARTCNPQPCQFDSSKTDALINQRASETCGRLSQNGAIDSLLYTNTGSVFNPHAHGKCEVSCAPVAGHQTPSFTRFGLMPQGTPCPGILDKMDMNDWPRRQGYNGRCLDGYCKKFGCDDVLNGGTFDECGVCNGDGKSCDVIQGTFTELTTTGSRQVIAEIPVGAYNIQFEFGYHTMAQNFLEVYTKDDAVVLASLIPSSWVWVATSNPVTFAGTYWYYTFYDSYLHAKGPLTEPAIIKLFKRQENDNTGIHFAYSLPKSVKSCQGQCSNGGTFNTKLCACDCASGYYGVDCSSRCNTFCYNGAPVDQSSCACQCNSHQTGILCKCAAEYTGKNCTMHT